MSANNFHLNQASDLFTRFPGVDVADEESQLREDLKYFFMSPCEKYRARRQLPWKLCLQILKIVMVTTQLILFGLSNQLVASFKEENTITFKHLFLKGYQGPDETDGSFIIYTQQDVYGSMFYIINQYLQLQNMTVGNYAYDADKENGSTLRICKQLFMKDVPIPSRDKLQINPSIVTECINIESASAIGDSFKEWKMTNASFFDIEFYRLILIEIIFKLKGIDLQTIRNNELPDCYQFTITITFDNTAHSGIIKVKLESETTVTECKEWKISGSLSKNTHYILIFDACVMLSCLMSLVLCTRSIILGLQLHKRFVTFFQRRCNQRVCLSDQLEFLNGWYILIIISDLFTVTGSIMKMEITAKNLTTYDICSIFLGTSTLFTWVGVIRYLGYFQKYNFEKLSTVAECLFSLINGDDMFATFAEIQEKSNLLWLFSRVYLYSFISLFIYMVLSLFIALITDTYETIKKFQLNGFPQTDLHIFMRVCTMTPELSRDALTYKESKGVKR
ncbi:mucolipin-2-like isoform X3 [Chiloscyllium plagiosum]|uniref:mucolipin-2-like isoform X3 n=1 Tax=Chiloscyllium plagiosum TaxID=36176 RepID=UPI001CB87B71|nr:mucolipin-2-like isoform X3 [Chiloscyllium plagiosum]